MVGEVLDVKDYGLMVRINRAQEALLHISEISHDKELLKTPLPELFFVGQRFKLKVSPTPTLLLPPYHHLSPYIRSSTLTRPQDL